MTRDHLDSIRDRFDVKKSVYHSALTTALTFAMATATPAQAQSGNAAELGEKLNNPLAALISVPFQFDYNNNLGLDDEGDSWNLKVEPVVPIRLNDNWNLISRTIISLTQYSDFPAETGTDFGIGDTTQSFFLSPSQVKNGWTWGVGPALLVPTSSWNDKFSRPKYGTAEWGAGPTAVVLRQKCGWTYGALVNHIWDVSGDTEISNTYLQPFLAYTTPTAWTYAINSESSYNWEADNDRWSVPINLQLGKVIGHVQYKGAIRYWAKNPEIGAEGWGARFVVTFMFPEVKK